MSIDFFIPSVLCKTYVHRSYNEAKREMNAGWSRKYSRRLKVVDERVLYKVKAGKYMVDSEMLKENLSNRLNEYKTRNLTLAEQARKFDKL
jgi:hypothetical protein